MNSTLYPIQIGAVRGHIIADGVSLQTPADIAAKFPDHGEAMRAASGTVPTHQSRNVLLLEIAGERLLIDTGEGMNAPDNPGMLLPVLRENGIAPDSITLILISHFHLDHIGGLLDNGKPTFPNARVLASHAEFDYWMAPDRLAAMPEPRARLLRETFAAYPRLERVGSGVEIVPGVTLLPADGHTPGQVAALFESDGERLLYVADSWHFPQQLNLPDASIKYDLAPEKATATRRALMNRAEADGLLTLGFHFEFPGLGYIRRDGERRVWERV